MSESKHTPGPWKWSDYRWRGTWSGIEGPNMEPVMYPMCCRDGDEGDAWFEPGESISEADANLIAAAPDLYEAVREWLSERDNPSPCWAMKQQAEAKMRSALAKAEGREVSDG